MARRDDIDFARSRAILLGTSRYEAGFRGRSPMPAALRSLGEMQKVLTGPCEWPSSRVSAFPNERDSGQLLRKITGLLGDVEDVLLFYYVGHGLPLPEDGRYDLGLALTDTDDDPAHRALTSLRLRHLREVLAQNCGARINVLALDCCCSGIATKYAGASRNLTEYAESATPARGAGTYVWAACGHSQETYFEDGKHGLTYFTRAVSEAVREARGQHTAGATVASLHDVVRHRMRTLSTQQAPVPPVPDLHYSGRPDQFLFVRGKAPLPPERPFTFDPLEDGDPRRVGPYDVVAKLGAGGSGRVFLAFTPTRQAVAVKLLRSDLGQDPEFAERFGREIALARRVRSSHVARVLDADPAAREPWLASSYVCGPSLYELVRDQGPLPARDVLLITANIARALEAIMAAGAVHRDLKPANVMLDDTGPKVIDFSIARSITTSLNTRTNVHLGTPAYKSPEQALGTREVTAASDVFTLGSTMYFLATGRDAFEAEDPLGMINLIATQEPDLDVLDDEVRGVVVRCMAKDPADRPTATQVVQMCADVLGPVAALAYPYIAGAGPAIAARAAALRALAPPPEPHVDPPRGRPRRSPDDENTEVRPHVGPTHTRHDVPRDPPGRPRTPSTSGTSGTSRPSGGNGNQQKGVLGAVAVVLIVLAAVLVPKHLHTGTTASDSGGSSSDTTTAPAWSPPDVAPEPSTPDDGPTDDDGGTDPTTPDDPPSTTTDPPTTAPPAPDVYRDSSSGDCLANKGSFEHPDLVASSCVNGAFQVLQVRHGTTDTSQCDSLGNDDYNASSKAVNTVLCLTYRTSSAYHARAGSCVYGPNSSSSTWYEKTCQTGNFRVVQRIGGTTDKSRCPSGGSVDESLTTSTNWPQLNVLLCLSMNYPDAAGRAKVNQCLLRTVRGSTAYFTAVNCNQANVVVTGRTHTYHDTAFCGSNGWTTWPSNDFPAFSYTVCFRNL